MSQAFQQIAALACCLVSFIFVCISLCQFYFGGGRGNMEGIGKECFRYFTVDSNILVALSSLAMVVCLLLMQVSDVETVPNWLRLFHFAGVTAVSLTFLTVLLFLGPKIGYGKMFEGGNIYMHLIVPILAIVSVLLLGGDLRICLPGALVGLIPTVLYGIVYVVRVVFQKTWPDFYQFLSVGPWGVFVGIMLLGTALIAFGLWELQTIF